MESAMKTFLFAAGWLTRATMFEMAYGISAVTSQSLVTLIWNALVTDLTPVGVFVGCGMVAIKTTSYRPISACKVGSTVIV